MNEKILFNNSSPDRKAKEIISVDTNFNILNNYETSAYYPWELSTIASYREMYIVSGLTTVNMVLFSAKLFSQDFNLIGELEDEIPFFKDKAIMSVINDDKGGIYFCESMSGVLHYLNPNGNISSYQGNFIYPIQLAYFNDTLYIIDFFQTANLKKTRNISTFRNGAFQQTELTGESIAYSKELDCFFVGSGMLENTIKKYDAEGNLIFTKDFDFSETHYTPVFLSVNKNHLLVCARESNSPIVYDIY
ncbi:MAG: hypothetical protein AB1454_11510 [Candidatus Auribacterota bacterium]